MKPLPLRLSVLDLVPVMQKADSHTALGQAVTLARTAEKLGYTRYWVSEHHDMKQLASACPEVLLAHIGAHTEHIRIGSGAVLLPHYQPVKVAEAFHLLATLHPGRIDLGIGRAPGGSAHVTLALSGNFLENVQKMPDKIRDLTALIEGEFTVEGERVTARPVPPDSPELWLLGTNAKSAAYAAEYGTGYVFGRFMSDNDGAAVLGEYRSAFRPSRLLAEPRAIVAVGAVCAETEERARELAAEGAGWLRSGLPAAEEAAGSEAVQVQGRDRQQGALSAAGEAAEGRQPEKADTPDRRTLIGTAGQIKEQLHELQNLYGADEFLLVTQVADYAQRLKSYELLASCIIGPGRQ
ncbi:MULTISPECIES: LLM class flavin-dependent oxidoreductase [unclassified Paenibacillus]|uniref:LLM class flavin-dependent oxidoreductase n=1 Tax=unclassified Paenibacillus TaxID=185978 RepID=UPI00020D65F4|nr:MULTISPECIES: LLM class flavin-dependent oxidoreductase [unclassified Paenibacillus]EGL20280.1 luciferase family oxidoreductase, FMN-dependent, PP_0088 family [Paenibacillus sp. HGF7]EPD88971.1 luciferase family oxidoreductase, group 1 [Paenibacillus sp. HGH0039]